MRRVLGVLRSLAPESLLDVGSGRGAFLWPLLEEFPDLPVTAIDRSRQRAGDVQAVHFGGIERLTGHEIDVTNLGFAADSFDVVTLLEVLEHVPDAETALAKAVRVARRSLVLSVPSKADDNPEHIHLFDERRLRIMFERDNPDYIVTACMFCNTAVLNRVATHFGQSELSYSDGIHGSGDADDLIGFIRDARILQRQHEERIFGTAD